MRRQAGPGPRRKGRRGDGRDGRDGTEGRAHGRIGQGGEKSARKTDRDEDMRRSHLRKAPFATRREAEETARFWNMEIPIRFTQLEPYPCRYGDHYHIGHMREDG